MAALATFSDLRARFDERVIARYASDTGVPVPVASLPTNARVVAALRDAEGLVVSACVKGKRYERATLEALAADTEKGALLRSMVSSLAMAQIMAGRVAGVDEIEEIVHGYKAAREALEELRNGSLVFDLPGTLTATLPDSSTGPVRGDPNRITTWNPIFGYFDERRYR